MSREAKLSDDEVLRFRKRAKKYVEGKGRLDPKWIKLPVFNSAFMDSVISTLDADGRNALYPFAKDTKEEIKFRILAVQRFCCVLAGDSGIYIPLLEEWMRDILRNEKKLRDKLGIDWTDPVEVIVNSMLEDKKNEDTNQPGEGSTRA